ncbi:MAG: HlyD family type I secretion periplasmic adaptor subunit [Micavibrio sp.]
MFAQSRSIGKDITGKGLMGKSLMDKGLTDNYLQPHFKRPGWLRFGLIPIICATLAFFLIWATLTQLDEVAVGAGKVTPSSKSQIIQSLEGGIVESLQVNEGDVVEIGQVLATLDRTRFKAIVGESEAKALSLEATAARLQAEVTGKKPEFSDAVRAMPDLVEREMALYNSRQHNLGVNSASLREQLGLVQRELELTEPLVDMGAASPVEVIRLRRQINELTGKLDGLRNQYISDANAEYTRTMSDFDVVRQTLYGRQDQLNRTELTSPVRGVVQNLDITTIGGVVQPGGVLMEIVPIEDTLLVEARISPRDIAFIRPNLPTTVKITAYDPSIYGTLSGVVDRISPDTIEDEVNRTQVYYRAYIRTDESHLRTKNGKLHPIMPGMVATVEIKTGAKTVLQYLLKPVNKAGEALRER